MPWTYTIDKDLDVVLITATGVLTGEEIRSGVQRATTDPSYHPGIRILIDYHAVTELKLSINTIETMANVQAYSKNSRRAFYVSLGYAEAIFQYYKTYVEAGLVEVFTDRTLALAWLNKDVPPERFIK